MTEEQIIRLYGERCAEHCDDCCVCEVWAMHDLIETQAREIERLRVALRQYVYETTSLSPREDDGSHWCKISANCLSNARAALAGDSHD